MSYDGTAKIGNELARLYGFSPKSVNKLAELMNEARTALGLGKAKRLTPKQNIAIFQYHQNKVGGSNIHTIDNDGNIPTADSSINNPIESSMNNPIDESPIDSNVPTTINDSNFPTIASDSNIPTNQFTKATEGAFKLINFSLKLGGARTVISLETYIVDALKNRFTLADNSTVRKWIELSMTDNFDDTAPIMRQVRFAIFQALINA